VCVDITLTGSALSADSTDSFSSSESSDAASVCILSRYRVLGMSMLINVVRGGRVMHSDSCSIPIFSCTGVRPSTPGTF
jgi:hypothetical protein